MKASEILNVIDRIEAEKGKAKVSLLLKLCREDSELETVLKEVLAFAYSPSVTFGINKIELLARLTDLTSEAGKLVAKYEWRHLRLLLTALARRKITGTAAVDAALAILVGDKDTQELFMRIVNKDLRCGIGTSSVLSAFPYLFPVFKVQLSKPFEIKRCAGMSAENPWLVEPKYDGVRAVAEITPEVSGYLVRLLSREGNHFPGYQTLEKHIGEWAKANLVNEKMYLDGEITSGNFNNTVGMAKRIKSDDVDAVYFVFDRFGRSKASDEMPMILRREELSYLLWTDKVQLIEQELATTEEEVHQLYRAYRDRGLEGGMVKDPNAPYVYKRGWHWMKLKDELTADVPVVGFEEGTGKYAGKLGALVVDYNGVLVSVGSGLSDAQREEFWEQRHDILGRIVEVEYHMVTPDGSLRHPRFVRFRDALTGSME